MSLTLLCLEFAAEARSFNRYFLLRRVFRGWQRRHAVRISIRNHDQLIQNIGNTFQQRRYFARLKTCINFLLDQIIIF